MAVAAAYRIPHSVFLSWDADDRAKAIAWHEREQDRCPGCGTRAAEWDPDQGGSADAYVPRVETCPGCMQRSTLAKGLSGDDGRHIVLVRNPKKGA